MSRLIALALAGALALAAAPALLAQQPTPGGAQSDPAVVVVAAATPTREAPFERRLPAPLRRTTLFELRVWQWLALPLLLAVSLLLASVVARVVQRALRRAIAFAEIALDDVPVRGTGGPLLLAFTVMFFALGLPVLAINASAETFLQSLLKGLGVAALAWVALRMIDVVAQGLGRRLEREGRRRVASIVPLGRRAAKFFLLAIALIMLLQNVGFNVTGLVAGLGVGGIAVALAAQKTLENIFGGVSVIIDQPVRVGDLCQFRDGRVGTVEEIGLRSTRIRTPDRTLVTIPNADFAQRELESYAARDRMRFFTPLRLDHETTPERLRAVIGALRDLLEKHPKVLAGSVRVNLVAFGASSLDLEVAAYVVTNDADEFNAIRELLLLSIMETVAAAGSALAFPSRTVYVARDPGLPAPSSAPKT